MLAEHKLKELQKFASAIRIKTITSLGHFGVGHIGGCLSIADCLAVLYGNQMKIDPKDPQLETRDWFILSKGHCGPALYATLALKGYFPVEDLETINQPHTNLPSHCDRTKTPGIDMTTGSLGQGASSAAGIALALKIQKKKSHVFLILGDGELQEGQVWEMALFAAQQKLANLIAFVDNNRIQLDGFTADINSLGDIRQKFEDFGWHTLEIDGHDVQAIDTAVEKAKKHQNGPSMIVMHTVKGKGWKAIENTVKSHSMTIEKSEADEVVAELAEQMERE